MPKAYGPTSGGSENYEIQVPAAKASPYTKIGAIQLAAYRKALGRPVKCMNLIVNSTEPSVPIEHGWSA